MGGRRGRIGVIGRVARAPEVLRLELAFMAFALAEDATWLAMLIYAFSRGGVGEVGMAAVVQLAPAVLVAPFAAYAGDRFRPDRALATGYGLQSVAMAATAIAMAAGVPLGVYTGAVVAATCITFTRPVMGSLLPQVTHSPNDLVAANVVSGLLAQVGRFAGPVIAGILIAGVSPAAVFGVGSAMTAAATVLALLADRAGELIAPRAPVVAGDVITHVLGGFTTLRQHGRLRVLVGLTALGGLTVGAADVLAVTFAEARLDGGGGQAGVLSGSFGFGALAGALVAAGLVSTARMSRYLAASALLVGLPFLVLAGADVLPLAMGSFALLGIGESLLALTSSVAIQRQADSGVLARVFGVVEGLGMGGIAVGSLAMSVLASWLTLGRALVAFGGVLLMGLLLGIARLHRLGGDAPMLDPELVDRLLLDAVFAPLAAPTIERLARNTRRCSVPAGTVVAAEGDVGTLYYLVVDGRLDVTIEGRWVRSLGPGQSFGEIAILRDVPRTATVSAATAVELLAIERGDFLESVTGHPRSMGRVTEVAERFLPT